MDLSFQKMDISKIFFMLGMVVLLSSVVTAEKLYVDAGQGEMINGKNVTFIGILNDGVNMQVDGDFGHIQKKNETVIIGGVHIMLLGLSKNPPIAILDVIVPFSCGDGTCSGGAGEDYASCCKDCGCLGSAKNCVNNICVSNLSSPTVLFGCLEDDDCSTSLEPCTTTYCNKEVIPFQCTTKDLEECIPGDGCCPISCTINNDNDCLYKDQCSSDKDCEDDDPCTVNTCSSKPKSCQTLDQGGCPKGDQCIPIGTIEGFTYCSQEEKIFSLRELGEACNYDYECISQQCNDLECGKGLAQRILPFSIISIFIICILLIAFYLVVLIRKRMEEEQ
jgi:hypothetical protein